jgi:phosphoribosylaminoimidazole (AIR) synthetase
MYKVFNMGIGMAVIVEKKDVKHFKSIRAITIGRIVPGDFGVRIE